MTIRGLRHLAELLEDAAGWAKSEEDWLAARTFQQSAKHCRVLWESLARTQTRDMPL